MLKTLLKTKLSIVLIALVLSACGGDSTSDNAGKCSSLDLNSQTNTTTNTDTNINTGAREKITNGQPCSGLNKSPVVIVLKNLPDGSTGLCTGTMLSANKVITAAHCLEGASSIDVLFGTNLDKFAYVTTSSWSIHPQYTRNPNGALLNDIGIVYTPVVLPVPNLPLLTSSAPQVGSKTSIFGYGVTTGSASDYGTLRAGAMTIFAVDSDNIYAKFEAASSNTCFGDSGGPMLQLVGNQQTIIGITSYGSSSSCDVGEISAFTSLQSPSAQSFIRGAAPDARYN